MTSENYAVVFDTNTYRNLTRNIHVDDIKASIAQLKEKESSKNIVAKATPVVGLEMLANLAGPGKSPHYEDCLKALVAMANHCYDGTTNLIHIVPHPYLHIILNLFGIVLKDIELSSKNMCLTVADFKDDYLQAIQGHEAKGTFDILKHYIEEEENLFVGELLNLIEHARHEVKKQHPSIARKHFREKVLEYIESDSFEAFVSMAILLVIVRRLHLSLPGDKFIKGAMLLSETFPLIVKFKSWVCHQIVFKKIDMHTKISKERRWNWRWDYEVSFLINDYSLSGRKVILVTSDKDMRKMMEKFGYGARVMDFAAYLEFLKD